MFGNEVVGEGLEGYTFAVLDSGSLLSSFGRVSGFGEQQGQKMKNERTKKWKENYCTGSVHYFMNDKNQERRGKTKKAASTSLWVCVWSGED